MAETVRNKPRTFRLSVRSDLEPNHGGEVRDEVYDPDRLAMSGASHILILAHGFNNTAKEAQESYNKQLEALQEAGLDKRPVGPDAIALFQWPGDLAISPIRNAIIDSLGYSLDLRQAFKAADRLADFLASLPKAGGEPAALKISFIGHSLGCRLILEALNRLNRGAPSFDVVSLMAAAVPVELILAGKPLVPRIAVPRRLLKFFSEKDLVLQFAFPAGQQLASNQGIERAAYREAVGRHGNPAGFGEPNPRHNNGHSDYWKDKVAAKVFVSTLDPTAPLPLIGREIGAHDLPAQNEMPGREMQSRNLPR